MMIAGGATVGATAPWIGEMDWNFIQSVLKVSKLLLVILAVLSCGPSEEPRLWLTLSFFWTILCLL